MRITRRALLGGALGGTALATAGVAGAELAGAGPRGRATGRISLATGDPLDVYNQYGEAFASSTRSQLGEVRLANTTGSVDNLILLENGQVTAAFVTADVATDALLGQNSFVSTVPLRALARLYDDYLHLVVPASALAMQSAADLRGARVSTGPVGSSTSTAADRVLNIAGIDPYQSITRKTLDIRDAATALTGHNIDALFWSGGLPTLGITALARRTPVRLLSLDSMVTGLRARYGWAYREGTIPAGTYPGAGIAVSTIAVPNLLVTLASTSDALVTELLRALFGRASTISATIPVASQLDPRTAVFTGQVPLHPAAAAYYRSVKIGA
jgi:TRAP transporter TAXI family solute receptor